MLDSVGNQDFQGYPDSLRSDPDVYLRRWISQPGLPNKKSGLFSTPFQRKSILTGSKWSSGLQEWNSDHQNTPNTSNKQTNTYISKKQKRHTLSSYSHLGFLHWYCQYMCMYVFTCVLNL